QMRGRGEPRRTDVADHILLRDARTHLDAGCETAQVRIARRVAVDVANLDHPAVTTIGARKRHGAVGRHLHRRARTATEIRALMCAVYAEHRVIATRIVG